MAHCPSAFDYKIVADNQSMYNTPPTYGIYIAGLTFHFLYFIGIEVAIVALLAASAVVLPQGGGRAEALTVCGMGLGHIAGAFVSLPIWEAADRRLFGYALLAGSACAALAGVSWALERFTRLGPLGGAGGASQEDRRIAADGDAEEQKREDDGEAQAVGASA